MAIEGKVLLGTGGSEGGSEVAGIPIDENEAVCSNCFLDGMGRGLGLGRDTEGIVSGGATMSTMPPFLLAFSLGFALGFLTGFSLISSSLSERSMTSNDTRDEEISETRDRSLARSAMLEF